MSASGFVSGGLSEYGSFDWLVVHLLQENFFIQLRIQAQVTRPFRVSLTDTGETDETT
jgi:hypothetical protein